jgi:hypothetical protein
MDPSIVGFFVETSDKTAFLGTNLCYPGELTNGVLVRTIATLPKFYFLVATQQEMVRWLN